MWYDIQLYLFYQQWDDSKSLIPNTKRMFEEFIEIEASAHKFIWRVNILTKVQPKGNQFILAISFQIFLQSIRVIVI